MTEDPMRDAPRSLTVAIAVAHGFSQLAIAATLQHSFEGIDTVRGTTCSEAVELRFRDPAPAMVIIDEDLEDGSGRTALAAIRDREAAEGQPRVPIVFMHTEQYPIVDALFRGADLWLDKGVHPAQLRAVVKALLGVPCRTGGTRGG